MNQNSCTYQLDDGAQCGRDAWWIDPTTVSLRCDAHRPHNAIDTLPVVVNAQPRVARRELLRRLLQDADTRAT